MQVHGMLISNVLIMIGGGAIMSPQSPSAICFIIDEGLQIAALLDVLGKTSLALMEDETFSHLKQC